MIAKYAADVSKRKKFGVRFTRYFRSSIPTRSSVVPGWPRMPHRRSYQSLSSSSAGETLTPETTGREIVRPVGDDSIASQLKFMLPGAGLQPID